MILFPNAKINLGLHIVSKREDNYHNLESLMHPVGLCDILEFLPFGGSETIFRLSGIPIAGTMEENLVFKAYKLLQGKYNLPNLKIHLHKIIPSGAGLGGGSSDASFMLKGLNEFFKLHINPEELRNYSSLLGSDCAFFIDNTPAIASGKGEILNQTDDFIKNYRLFIFFPGFEVSTAEAYQGIHPIPGRENLLSLLEKGIENWKTTVVNDFEKTVFEKYPVLKDLKDRLYQSGAVYASMSGSGSAVYGIFEKNYILPDALKKQLIYKSA